MSSPWNLGSSFVQMVGTISRRMKPWRSLEEDDESLDEPTPKRPRASSYRILSRGGEHAETDEPAGSGAGGGDHYSRGWSFPGCDSGAVESTSDDGSQFHTSKKPRFIEGMVEVGSRKRRRESNGNTGMDAGRRDPKQGDGDGLSDPEEEYPFPAPSVEWGASATHQNVAFGRRIGVDEFGNRLMGDVCPEPGFYFYPLITAEDILEPEIRAFQKDSGAFGYRVPPAFSFKENCPVNSKLHKHSCMKMVEELEKAKREVLERLAEITPSQKSSQHTSTLPRDNFTVAG